MTTRISQTFEGIPLTQEQSKAIELAASGKSLKIQAFAGTGKTSLLRAIARSRAKSERGLYLAFNKKIIEEADSWGEQGLTCSTFDSLAWRKIAGEYKKRGKLIEKLTPFYLLKEVFDFTETVSGYPVRALCFDVLSLLRKFCASTADEITLDFVNSNLTIKCPDSDKKRRQKLLCDLATQIWLETTDLSSPMPLLGEAIVKLWTMKPYKLRYDYILIDEAQDLTPAVLKFLEFQKVQLIWAGDSYQQIYEWRGAINALEIIKAEHNVTLTTSFRFGEQFADLANILTRFYFSATHKISGSPRHHSRLTPVSNPEAIIFRTNIALLEEALSRLVNDQSPYIVGGVKELQLLLRAARDLMAGKRANHPELAVFNNWHDAKEFAQTEEGIHLRALVKLIASYDINFLLRKLSQIADINEEGSEITLTTVHKAKGRQWHNVQLANDFFVESDQPLPLEEARLMYVAITRAISKLDIFGCEALLDMIFRARDRAETDSVV